MRRLLSLIVPAILVGCAFITPKAPPSVATAATTAPATTMATHVPSSPGPSSVTLAASPSIMGLPDPSATPPSALPPKVNAPASALTTGVRGVVASPSPTADVRLVTVILDRFVNMRSEPDIDATIVAVLAPGTAVMAADTGFIGANDATRWVPVVYDRWTGYIRADLLGGTLASGK